MIVRKSDGGFGYSATDLAAIRLRVNTQHANRIVYVVDHRQALHFDQIFTLARTAGWLPLATPAEHVSFGTVLGPNGKPFKTRAGGTVKLTVLLNEAVARAGELLEDREGIDREATARAVGIGAIKYADLSSDRVKDYVLDFDRMLAFEGNTGPYMQYAHARIRSIFRRGEVDPAMLDGAALRVGEPAERALALALVGFEGAVRSTAASSSPHRLCTYLFDLAQTFTTFYEACPVLRAEDDEARASRLVLCDLTARTLAAGLGLLGISAPDRM